MKPSSGYAVSRARSERQVKDCFETLRLKEGARLGSSRRILYAGGGSAIHRQRQKCEPGSHPERFAGSHSGSHRWERRVCCGKADLRLLAAVGAIAVKLLPNGPSWACSTRELPSHMRHGIDNRARQFRNMPLDLFQICDIYRRREDFLLLVDEKWD